MRKQTEAVLKMAWEVRKAYATLLLPAIYASLYLLPPERLKAGVGTLMLAWFLINLVCVVYTRRCKSCGHRVLGEPDHFK